MQFSEILKMSWASLGANKLRAALTMVGITIGVFSVISVMTAIGALQRSIEGGISFLGSNIFQFAKFPVTVSDAGAAKKKFVNRRNINYRSEEHTSELQSRFGISYAVFCLKKKKTQNKRSREPTSPHTNSSTTSRPAH